MHTNLQKWGNSLGLRIPVKMANELHLHKGSVVNLEIEDGRLVIESPKYDLDEMIKAIADENKHDLLLDDHPKGNEKW